MNKNRFYELVQNPEKITGQDNEDLKEIIKTYPFFQTSVILYSLGLKKSDNIHFESSLRKAAIYSKSRIKLKEWVSYIIDKLLISSDQNTINYPKEQNQEFSLSFSDQNDNESKANPDLLFSYEIEELKKCGKLPLNIKNNSNPNNCDVKKSAQSDLIQNFIDNHSFDSKKNVGDHFYNVDELADSSIIDSDEIVSETLAKIHFQQGNYLKALKIYKTLSLNIPEKNGYFVSQIREIKERLKNK